MALIALIGQKIAKKPKFSRKIRAQKKVKYSRIFGEYFLAEKIATPLVNEQHRWRKEKEKTDEERGREKKEKRDTGKERKKKGKERFDEEGRNLKIIRNYTFLYVNQLGSNWKWVRNR